MQTRTKPNYTHVAFKEYWSLPEAQRPQTLEEVCALLLPEPGIRGIWEIVASDNRTGEILERNIYRNAITDLGAQASIGNLFAATANAYGLMNIACISTEAGSTTLTTALVAGTAPTGAALGIAAAPNAIPAGTVKIDYSTGSEELVQTTGCAANATSLPVTAVGGGVFTPAYSHAVGKSVVPVAPVTDNPSASPAGAQYLALVAADYSPLTGTGQGLRTRTITKKYPGISTPAGTYTWFRLCNANPIVANSVGASCIVPQAIINGTTDQTFTAVIKL